MSEEKQDKEESSSKMSSLAGRYISVTREDLELALASEGDEGDDLIVDIRALAASVLSQDETKGQD